MNTAKAEANNNKVRNVIYRICLKIVIRSNLFYFNVYVYQHRFSAFNGCRFLCSERCHAVYANGNRRMAQTPASTNNQKRKKFNFVWTVTNWKDALTAVFAFIRATQLQKRYRFRYAVCECKRCVFVSLALSTRTNFCAQLLRSTHTEISHKVKPLDVNRLLSSSFVRHRHTHTQSLAANCVFIFYTYRLGTNKQAPDIHTETCSNRIKTRTKAERERNRNFGEWKKFKLRKIVATHVSVYVVQSTTEIEWHVFNSKKLCIELLFSLIRCRFSWTHIRQNQHEFLRPPVRVNSFGCIWVCIYFEIEMKCKIF